MTGARGRAPAGSQPVEAVVLLLALTAALLAAVLPGGGSTPAPERTLVAQLSQKTRASDLAGISGKARQAGARLVVLIPPQQSSLPPHIPLRQGWTPDAALSRGIAAMQPPAVVDLSRTADLGAVAELLPRSVEVVGEGGAVLRAADVPEGTEDTPPLRIVGLLALGLLAAPTARALLRHRNRSATARPSQEAPTRGQPRPDGGRPSPSMAAEDPNSSPEPPSSPPYGGHTTPLPTNRPSGGRTSPTGRPVGDPAPPSSEPPGSVNTAPPTANLQGTAQRAPGSAAPSPDRPTAAKPAPPPPPVFDIRAFEATLTSPETGPQCPRCGSFDLARTPRPAPGSEGACGRCAHRWHLDARCWPPRLLLEPDHFARELGGEGDDT